ncbi:MAG TPA: hypothetical protein VN039_02240 [Nitrospira sp.]|nr:hypothetical protein [Nitrospira sp.]
MQHVAVPIMTAVERLSLDTIELAHGARQIGVGGLHDQMKVIVHQTIGVQQQMFKAMLKRGKKAWG